MAPLDDLLAAGDILMDAGYSAEKAGQIVAGAIKLGKDPVPFARHIARLRRYLRPEGE